MNATSHCTGFVVNICLSYGSRGEIINGCKSVCEAVVNNSIKLEEIDEELFSRHLSTAGCSGKVYEMQIIIIQQQTNIKVT